MKKKLYVSPFNDVDGYYLVRGPSPTTATMTISLHRENKPAFVATLRATAAGQHRTVVRLQMVAPMAPLMGAWDSRPGHHAVVARGAGRTRDPSCRKERVDQL